MSEFFRDWLVWIYLYVQHSFVMMYWVTIPGLLICGFLSVRYRGVIRERLLRGGGGLLPVLYATGLGMTTPAGRRESLEKASTLMSRGVSPSAALAYFIASQSLGLYYLLLFTVLIGLEFGLGVLLGGLVMIFLTAISTTSISVLSPPENMAGETRSLKSREDLPTTWRGLLLSRRGWWAAVRDIGRLFKILWLPSVGGLLLGGLILAADMRKAWPLPFWLGDEGFGPAIASGFLGPVLSLISFSSPLGNFFVVASIWKTWTLVYPGVISFILASSLHPLNLRSVMNLFGPRAGWHIGLTLYLSAALSGLTAIGLFELLGVEVAHVPWFEPLVKNIMMNLPFTMLGTGGMGLMGKMTGM